MNYVEEFCDEIIILNHGNIVLSGNLKDIKRSFGEGKLVVSSLNMTAEQLAIQLNDSFQDLVDIVNVCSNRVIIKTKDNHMKNEVLQRLLDHAIDLEYFGLYEPSLNDIFVEKAGDE